MGVVTQRNYHANDSMFFNTQIAHAYSEYVRWRTTWKYRGVRLHFVKHVTWFQVLSLNSSNCLFRNYFRLIVQDFWLEFVVRRIKINSFTCWSNESYYFRELFMETTLNSFFRTTDVDRIVGKRYLHSWKQKFSISKPWFESNWERTAILKHVLLQLDTCPTSADGLFNHLCDIWDGLYTAYFISLHALNIAFSVHWCFQTSSNPLYFSLISIPLAFSITFDSGEREGQCKTSMKLSEK